MTRQGAKCVNVQLFKPKKMTKIINWATVDELLYEKRGRRGETALNHL